MSNERRANQVEIEKKIEDLDERVCDLIGACEENNKSIKALTESTEGLVEAWQAANGAVKVGAALGKFVKWASGLAVVGGFFTYIIQYYGNGNG